MITQERKTCVKSSGVLWIFWMFLVLLEGIRLRSNTSQWFRTVGDLTMVLICNYRDASVVNANVSTFPTNSKKRREL